MKAVVEIGCPWCDRSVNREIEFLDNLLPTSEYRVITCGTCDRQYAIKVGIKYTISYYEMDLIRDD